MAIVKLRVCLFLLAALIAENQALPERTLYWEHEGNSAIRKGCDKLVKKGLKSPWELFDMRQDRTEQNNLALSSPEKVKQMQAEWRSWAQRANVIPRRRIKRVRKRRIKRTEAA